MIRNLFILPVIYLLFGLGAPPKGVSADAGRQPAAQPPGKEPVDRLFLDAAVARLEHAKAYTLEVAKLMPEDKYDFKPTKDEMSFAEQLLHLASRLDWLTSQYLFRETGEADPFKSPAAPYKKDEVMATVTQAYDYTIDKIKNFDVSHLADSVYFEYMGAGRMSKLQFMNLLNDHQTHHRGQMMVYLRLNGIVPPDYMGW